MDHPSKSGLVQADINEIAATAAYRVPVEAFKNASCSLPYGTVYETELEVYAQTGPGGAVIGVISDVMLTLAFDEEGGWRIDAIRCGSRKCAFRLDPALYPFVAEGLALQAKRITRFIEDEVEELRRERRAS